MCLALCETCLQNKLLEAVLLGQVGMHTCFSQTFPSTGVLLHFPISHVWPCLVSDILTNNLRLSYSSIGQKSDIGPLLATIKVLPGSKSLEGAAGAIAFSCARSLLPCLALFPHLLSQLYHIFLSLLLPSYFSNWIQKERFFTFRTHMEPTQSRITLCLQVNHTCKAPLTMHGFLVIKLGTFWGVTDFSTHIFSIQHWNFSFWRLFRLYFIYILSLLLCLMESLKAPTSFFPYPWAQRAGVALVQFGVYFSQRLFAVHGFLHLLLIQCWNHESCVVLLYSLLNFMFWS